MSFTLQFTDLTLRVQLGAKLTKFFPDVGAGAKSTHGIRSVRSDSASKMRDLTLRVQLGAKST